MHKSWIFLNLCFLLMLGQVFSKTLTTLDLEQLDEADREKLIKKYIKLDKNGRARINLRFYELFSDCDNDTTIETAVMMDEFYEKFSKIFKGKFRYTNKPQLFCLPSRGKYGEEIARFTNGSVDAGWSAGMFISIGQENALFADFSLSAQVKETLIHEGTHQLMFSYTGGNRGSVWFEEGIATNFESWDIHRSAIQNLHRTVFDSKRRHTLFQLYDKEAELPVFKLLDMSSNAWSSSTKPGPNYSMAWLMVNSLLLDEQGKKILNQWMTGFRKDKTMESMLGDRSREYMNDLVHQHYRSFLLPLHRVCIPAEENGMEFSAFEERLNEYIEDPQKEHPMITYYRIALNPELDDDKKISAFSKLEREEVFHPELIAALAKLYVKTGNRLKSRRYVTLAQREDPLDESLNNLLENL